MKATYIALNTLCISLDLHYTELHNTALHCTALYCTVLYCTVLYLGVNLSLSTSTAKGGCHSSGGLIWGEEDGDWIELVIIAGDRI